MEEILDAEGTPEGAAPADEAFQKAQAEWVQTCQGWKRDYPVVLERHLEDGTETEANVYAFARLMSERLNEGQIVVVGNGSANVVCGHGNIMKKGTAFYLKLGNCVYGIWAACRYQGLRGGSQPGYSSRYGRWQHSDESSGIADSDWQLPAN